MFSKETVVLVHVRGLTHCYRLFETSGKAGQGVLDLLGLMDARRNSYHPVAELNNVWQQLLLWPHLQVYDTTCHESLCDTTARISRSLIELFKSFTLTLTWNIFLWKKPQYFYWHCIWCLETFTFQFYHNKKWPLHFAIDQTFIVTPKVSSYKQNTSINTHRLYEKQQLLVLVKEKTVLLSQFVPVCL